MTMTAVSVATVGHGASALWYLTRASGLVSLILLSATLALGIVTSVGWQAARWPRFLSRSLHRNLSLFCLALIGVHVATTVADGYVPITFLDAIIPFRSPYRPLYIGFAALALDLLLAVSITSGLRRFMQPAVWKGVHWLAYACWPLAVVHGLGSGSDAQLPGTLVITSLCCALIAAAVAWRLAKGRAPRTWRLTGAAAGVLGAVAIAAFALLGPLRPGWSHRSGTATWLLSSLATSRTTTPAVATTPAANVVQPSSGLPSTPFTTAASGSLTQSSPDDSGNARVTINLVLADTSSPLQIVVAGPAVDGGVEMRQSQVTFGPWSGSVTLLEGTTIEAQVTTTTGTLDLTVQLQLSDGGTRVSGQVAGQVAA